MGVWRFGEYGSRELAASSTIPMVESRELVAVSGEIHPFSDDNIVVSLSYATSQPPQ